MRTPECISAPRAKAFTSENVARFFFYINEAQFNKKVNHQSLSIFSVDEMEITAVQHRQSIVVSEGQRRSGVSNIGRKGTLITVITCVNANGSYTHFPSLMVFSRKNTKGELTDGAPAVSISA